MKSSSVIDLSGVTGYSFLGKLSLDATSSPVPMTSGVPQGSILNTMFYVNSLPDTVRSSWIDTFAMVIQRYVFKEVTSTSDVGQL